MPVYRDKDGNIIEQPTEVHSDPQVTQKTSDPVVDSNEYDAATQKVGSGRRGAEGSSASTDAGAKTQVYRPGRSSSPSAPAKQPEESPITGVGNEMQDPPVGWLVVVSGPGKGSALTLGMGANSIGRDADQRVSIDFGDEHISRKGHSILTYDPKGRKFFIQQGSGTNLTYIDDQPVLAPVELEGGTQISIGETVLRFVPLCSPNFNWEE